jgi:hypothetical protein
MLFSNPQNKKSISLKQVTYTNQREDKEIMAERLYDDSEYDWSYRIEGDVAVFDMEGWQGFEEEELKSATEAPRKVVS